MNTQSLLNYISQRKLQVIFDAKLIKLQNEILTLKGTKQIKSPPIKYEISIPIQVLIAHYSGMLDNNEITNIENAKNIQKEFGTIGYENHRKKLSRIQELKTVKRLEKVCKYFENSGNSLALEKATKDLQDQKEKSKKVVVTTA